MITIKELKEQAQELLDFGNSKEKAKGDGMMQVIKEIEQNYVPKWKSVVWDADDFKMRAKQREKSNWKNIYDATKFEDALEKMIQKHDANEGINWDVLDFWLDEICKKEKL